MNSAIVAITNDIGAEAQVMEALCQMPSVRECYMVYGVYDMVAKVEASSEEEMSRTILAMRELPGVRSTLTLVVCREHKR
ncbi:MAG: Lrp/AsnC ligand binding domain-containing protein [Methanomassiliicoccales archaeon]|jgi:DNA-binding Lrp family transcriptional regulator|nr:Lrp/AsnC ligand binding domain-containing protein [Methanomassiliicoccales archaeon]